MTIKKCDLCRKSIKGEPIMASEGYFNRAELCGHCGLPVLNFLKKHKLVKESGSLEVSKKRK